MVTLYHYTTLDGIQGILDSGHVMQSTGPRDAFHGAGVYLTSKSPAGHLMLEISRNNFDGKARVWKSKKNLRKVQCALEFRFPAWKVDNVSTGRDIWVYRDGALDVDEYQTGRLFYSDPDGGYKEGVQEAWYMEQAA